MENVASMDLIIELGYHPRFKIYHIAKLNVICDLLYHDDIVHFSAAL